MKKNLYLIVFLSVISVKISGQNLELVNLKSRPFFNSTNEVFNRFILNSSYTAENRQTEVGVISYLQTVGYPGVHEQFDVFATHYVDYLKCGLGLHYSAFSYDFQDNQSYSALYSTTVYHADNVNVKLGAKLGLLRKKFNFDNSIVLPDFNFGIKNYWINNPFLDLGVSVQYKKLAFGLSLPNLSRTYYKYNDSEKEYIDKGFIFNASYKFDMIEKFIFSPYIVDYYYNKNAVSLGLLSGFKDRYFLNLNYNGYMKSSAISASVQLFHYMKIALSFESQKDNTLSMFSVAVCF